MFGGASGSTQRPPQPDPTQLPQRDVALLELAEVRSHFAPGRYLEAVEFIGMFLADYDSLRFYAVWDVAGDRSMAGVHASNGRRAYDYFMEEARGVFSRVRFRSARSPAEAVRTYLAQAQDHGVSREVAFHSWL